MIRNAKMIFKGIIPKSLFSKIARVILLVSFIATSVQAWAQDYMIFTNDTLLQGYDSSMQDRFVLKSKPLNISKDEAIRMEDRSPAFAAYRDNYFVTGIPLNKKVTTKVADAVFQLSIRHRITKSILPFNTFAYLTYTQKSFWNIYTESSPFRDTNYNPGLGIGKYLFHNNKLAGAAFLQVMHESNGRDGDDSRSWNYLSLSMKYYLNARLSLFGEFWVPYFVDADNNKDLTDYRGLGYLSANYISNKHKWWLSAEVNPRDGVENINTTLSAAYRISERANQYLFVRFFQGYGESQKDYDKYSINIRVGICIKPDFYSMF